MWLPKDERKLLQGYYSRIGKVNEEREIPLEELIGFIKSSASVHLAEDWTTIVTANEALQERKLIKLSHDNDIFIDAYKQAGAHPRLTVSLTITGYDLGRKYDSWVIRSGLWFAEYRHHWIWVIMGFIGGMIATLLVQVLLRLII